MALRDKLRSRVQPFLGPGEQVEAVFLAQQGPSPYLMFLSSFFAFMFKYRIVAVTNQRIAVFSAGAWTPAKPKQLLESLPRETTFGEPHGLWAKIDLRGETFYVHARFHGDLRAANAAGPPASPPPGAVPPPPAAAEVPPPPPPPASA